MMKQPDAVEVLSPSSDSVIVYDDGQVQILDDYVVVHLEESSFHFPHHRVHRLVYNRGDEE
jgi:hypothetical protein